MNQEIAILIAAGKGERMRPLTLTTPKPLVKVKGQPMIETIIKGLNHRGVLKIYIVVGYLKEKFCYLKEKYPNVELIENREYKHKNNISSLHAVADILGKSDCFITDADLYISDVTIFDEKFHNSCGFGKFYKEHTDEWVYELEGGKVSRIGPGGDASYIMSGISFFKKKDAGVLADAVCEAYKQIGHEQLFWDNILNQNLDKINLTVNPVKEEQIVEIDSVDELKKFDTFYNKVNSAV